MPPRNRYITTGDLLAEMDVSLGRFAEAAAESSLDWVRVREYGHDVCDLSQLLNVAIGAQSSLNPATCDVVIALMSRFLEAAEPVLRLPVPAEFRLRQELESFVANVSKRVVLLRQQRARLVGNEPLRSPSSESATGGLAPLERDTPSDGLLEQG